MTNRTHTGCLRLAYGRIYTFAVAASLLAVCGPAAGCRDATPTAPSAGVVTSPAPTIVSVSPSLGSTSGGASVTITARGLVQGVRVSFGPTSVPASFARDVDDRVFVTAPSHAAGSVDVTVTNPDGRTARR